MKILSAQQIREADQATIANEPIASIDLMERAASRCTDWLWNGPLAQRLQTMQTPVWVLAGPGNNGGDGLVIARQLAERNVAVTLCIVRFSDQESPDFAENCKRLEGTSVSIQEITSEQDFPDFEPGTVVIDALFGSGLNRPVEGFTAKLIDRLNETRGLTVVSIDLPSGLFAELNEDLDRRAVVRAHFTLTFESPKLAMLFPESAPFVGAWTVLPIGLDPTFMQEVPTAFSLTHREGLRDVLLERPVFAHKGTFGHALLAAGRKGSMGAATMAVEACLKSGSGLVTAHVPGCGLDILQISNPEAMVTTDPATDMLTERIDPKSYSAIGIGPGIGTEPDTEKVIKLLIQDAGRPMVFDADAINILAENKTWLSFLPPHCIFTPHPGEFKRLVGGWKHDFERLDLQREFARKYKAIVVLKGAYTSIADPNGRVFFNQTGNPGMAKGGSGDVLTGLITGLLAQRYDALSAAVLGVFLHGAAGDFAAEELGQEAMTARDITRNLHHAFRFLCDGA